MAAVALLPLLAWSAEGQSTISKARVQAVLASMDTAIGQNDTTALLAHFEPQAVVSVTGNFVDSTGRYQIACRYDRGELQDWLKIGFLAYNLGKPRRKIISIEIASNGKSARCKSTVVEKCSRIDGELFLATSQESLSFALVNGKIMVTKDREEAEVR